MRTVKDSNLLHDKNVKNENELDCNSAITNINSRIKCVSLKLDMLKHFVGPSLIAPILVNLEVFQVDLQTQSFLIDFSITIFMLVIFLFWRNFKELKYNYTILGNFESMLYHLKNKIEYSEEEMNKIRAQKFSRNNLFM
ncbi:MAG: hypothetical protein KHW81_17915 [[Clostridium] innocuum]|nr:hypothetical protein [[Clostridium] innocuum]MBS5686241.1 hypothetical protein [[Clostridium] innocuum]